jgi:cobalt/nickel transport system ATP-binding protein
MFLDQRGRRDLTKHLMDWPGALLIATHELDWVRMLCPRSLLLDSGRLVVDRPTDEVFGNQQLLQDHGLA